MNAIIKHENVYVWVKNDEELRADENLDDSLIIRLSKSGKKVLYSGRVFVQTWSDGDISIKIDGVTILNFMSDYNASSGTSSFEYSEYWKANSIVAFLNQIENLGVDSFLENYKNNLYELKKYIEERLLILLQQGEDDKTVETISNCKQILLFLVYTVINLTTHMNAGLTNQHYSNAYDTIINTYF